MSPQVLCVNSLLAIGATMFCLGAAATVDEGATRSEERRVGKECVP